MNLSGKVVVVTGGAHGIGRALCQRFAQEGARGVVVADLDEAAAAEVARGINGLAVRTDVSREADLLSLIERAEQTYGPVDVFCSNAGIGTGGGADAPDAVWQRTWEVNVMAHVWAARALVPKMIQRGGGYLLNTASAAGMLTSIGAAPYAVTKHAAVAMAEWLSITHGDQGVRVSVLAPLGVKTHLLEEADKTETGISIRASGPVLEPEQVADVVVKGMEEERFLILPHPEVAGFTQRKLADYEKWIQHMRKMQAKAKAEVKR